MSAKKSGKVLASTARMYHDVYQYEVAYKLASHHHLSVLMPPNIGLDPIAFKIASIFGTSKRIAVIVSTQEDVDALFLGLPGGMNEHLLFPYTVEQCKKTFPGFDAYILFELSRKERLALHDELLPLTNRIVISVARPNEEDQKNSSFSAFADLTSVDTMPHPLVFAVESILDIRDLMFAAIDEKSRLMQELQQLLQLYQLDAIKLKQEVESADQQDQVREELDSTKKELEQLKKQLAARERFITSLEEISVSAGMDWDAVVGAAAQLATVKEKYSALLDAADGESQDTRISELQNEVSEILQRFSEQKMTLGNTKAYEELLVSVLGNEVWEKLSSSSKSFLISARMSYDAMTSSKEAESLDYSGVCLLAAKVLDFELSKRIYNLYKVYLQRKYPQSTDMDGWPDGMVTSSGKRGVWRPVTPEEFTLGSVCKTLGVDRNGKVTNEDFFEDFAEFAKVQLYKPGMSIWDVKNRVKEIAIVAEKVRIDFRNPSAHRQQLPITSAKECMDYLLDRLKKLKLLLQDMSV
ncbi:MAG: hypothetical protein IJQ02_11955 [Oscillospiraceae bacterium]|nr:hypothetical protein [Oscillospiraceae bacterium]